MACITPSAGLSGGLIALWRKELFGIDFMCINNLWCCGIITLEERVPWLLCGVYAKCSTVGRRKPWNKADELLEMNLHVMLVSDFNCVIDVEEKLSEAPFEVEQDVREF